MSKLHILAHSIDLTRFKTNLARLATSSDQFLFIADAVTSLLDIEMINFVEQQKLTAFALKADCLCRGIEPLLSRNFSQITDQQMVELTLAHRQSISW